MAFSTEEKRDFLKNVIVKHSKCSVCLLLKRFCICSTLTLLREKYKKNLKCFSNSNHQFCIFADLNQKYLRSLRVYVLIHYKEVFRASNTAKLINFLLSNIIYSNKESNLSSSNDDKKESFQGEIRVEFITYQVVDEMERLNAVLKASRNNTNIVQFALYPTRDSVPFHTYLSDHCEIPSQVSFQIILVDGTWQQARRMIRCLPEWLTRISLKNQWFTKSRLRTQTVKGRVTTLEAFAYLLEEMVDSSINFCDFYWFLLQSIRVLLLEGLQILNNTLLKQTCKLHLIK